MQLLTVASWALAGSGWAYVLLPRPTLDALFGESGGRVIKSVNAACLVNIRPGWTWLHVDTSILTFA